MLKACSQTFLRTWSRLSVAGTMTVVVATVMMVVASPATAWAIVAPPAAAPAAPSDATPPPYSAEPAPAAAAPAVTPPPPGSAPAPGAPPPPGYAAPPPGYGYPYPYPSPQPYPYPGYAPYGYGPYPGYPAPPRPPRPGYRTHDGLYLRMQAGIGYSTLKAVGDAETTEWSGSSTHFAVALGGALTTNLILYGQFSMMVLSSPGMTVNGQPMQFQYASSPDLMGIGPGLAYYFTEQNVFIAETVAFSEVDVTYGSGSNWGINLETLVGKEWWVSTNWGLGISGQFVYARLKSKADPTFGTSALDFTALSGSVLFSATYN